MVAAAAGLPDLVPVPVVRGADSGDLEHAPTADGVDDTCVLAVIRVVTSGECRCFRCLASLNRLNGRSPRVFVRPASAWLLLPSSAADTGDSAAAGLPKMPKNMKIKIRFAFSMICMRTGCTSFASHCRYAPRLSGPRPGVFYPSQWAIRSLEKARGSQTSRTSSWPWACRPSKPPQSGTGTLPGPPSRRFILDDVSKGSENELIPVLSARCEVNWCDFSKGAFWGERRDART